MGLTNMTIYGIVLFVIITILLVAAIWLAGVLLKEAEAIKHACKSVSAAYGFVDIEIGKKLKDNNAIHFYDLMRIVDRIRSKFPGVKVDVDKVLERSQVRIVISQGDVRSTYTLLATIVEIPYQTVTHPN